MMLLVATRTNRKEKHNEKASLHSNERTRDAKFTQDVLSLVENGTLENMGTAENVLIDRASISKKFESELRAYEAMELLTIDYQFTNTQALELYREMPNGITKLKKKYPIKNGI